MNLNNQDLIRVNGDFRRWLAAERATWNRELREAYERGEISRKDYLESLE